VGAADRERLERLVRDRNAAQKVVWRARIVLLASDRLTTGAIATAVGKSVPTVQRRRRRYMAKGVDGLLKDATRPSRVKPLMPEKTKQVVHMTLHERPPNATQWSVRSLAKAAGISYTSVQRIWHAHGLKPHLYLNPSGQGAGPLRRRKAQIPALDHTQPGLPVKKGACRHRDDPGRSRPSSHRLQLCHP
jgi:transposase